MRGSMPSLGAGSTPTTLTWGGSICIEAHPNKVSAPTTSRVKDRTIALRSAQPEGCGSYWRTDSFRAHGEQPVPVTTEPALTLRYRGGRSCRYNPAPKGL